MRSCSVRTIAARAAATAATSAGDNATIFLQLGAAMTIAQRPADVEQYLTRAVEIDPKNPESITRLGLAKARTERSLKPPGSFERALSVQPGYEPAQRALARVPAALQAQLIGAIANPHLTKGE